MASSVVERRKSVGLVQPSLEFYAGLQKRPSDIAIRPSRKAAKGIQNPPAASKTPSVPFNERPTCSIAEACAAAGFWTHKAVRIAGRRGGVGHQNRPAPLGADKFPAGILGWSGCSVAVQKCLPACYFGLRYG